MLAGWTFLPAYTPGNLRTTSQATSRQTAGQRTHDVGRWCMPSTYSTRTRDQHSRQEAYDRVGSRCGAYLCQAGESACLVTGGCTGGWLCMMRARTAAVVDAGRGWTRLPRLLTAYYHASSVTTRDLTILASSPRRWRTIRRLRPWSRLGSSLQPRGWSSAGLFRLKILTDDGADQTRRQ